VFAGDADRSAAVASAEAGVLDQPCGGNFSLRVQGWITGNLQILGGGSGCELLILGGGENWIFEEGSGAAAVIVTGGDEHAFSGADLSYRISRVGQGWLLVPSGKVFLEVGICEVCLAAMLQRIVHLHDNVSPALGGVEDAGAVAEAAGFFAIVTNTKLDREEYRSPGCEV